jgi:hypothetical protein
MADDGYLIGFEDSNGNFVEVGRFNNTADDVTQPLEIKHQNSGERITLDSSGFGTSGDISVGGSVQSTDEVNLLNRVNDPQSPDNGDIWFRSDERQFRVQTDTGIQVLKQISIPQPDSVLHQYTGENFTTTSWSDSVGQKSMSINGVSASTLNGDKSASSDGVDDLGKAAIASLFSQQEFGIAFVFQTTDNTDGSSIMGVAGSGSSTFVLQDSDFFDGSLGELQFFHRDDNNNAAIVETVNSVADGKTHLAVVNKASDDAQDISIYVDDMSQPANTVVHQNAFDRTAFSVGSDFGFFGRTTPSGFSSHKEIKSPFFEFNGEIYDQDDRLDLQKRAPGI